MTPKMFDEKLREMQNCIYTTAKLLKLKVPEVHLEQALILYRMGQKAFHPSEIHSFIYTGSNPSYNISALKSKGYITSWSSKTDKRSVLCQRTAKGDALALKIETALQEIAAGIQTDGGSLIVSSILANLAALKGTI